MSVSIGISAAATANAAAANAAAQRAKTIACESFVRGYEHDKSTSNQAREYAECIYRLYPSDISSGDVVLMKLWVVCMIVGVLVGFFYTAKQVSFSSRPDIGDRLMGAIIGLAFSGLAPGAIYLAWIGVKFVVQA